jgi:2-methylisocitrate lyase-like PEP mutase family enzyme
MTTQSEKIARFRQLHEGGTPFILANAWTVGSARTLTRLGFEAIGTTSAGLALDLGLEDGEVGRDRTLANARAIAAATHLPVSADLEDGFGDTPEACADTIRQAIDGGLAGGSIEDSTGKPDAPVHSLDLAVARVRAAVEAARASGTGFVVTARAENFASGRPDLDDTITRLKAFAEAGADVLFAPNLPDLAAIRAVCSALDKPVNVLMGYRAPALSQADLEQAGVRRISIGSALPRAAEEAWMAAARAARDGHSFHHRQAVKTAFTDAG